jgi:predicted nucleic acid-binding protein
MIAVSNTTPLRYLIAIGHEGLLGNLFHKVIVPRAVYDELTDQRTPELVRRFVLSPPAWLEVRQITDVPGAGFPVGLHRGERETILLAEALRPDAVLMDEQAGRAIARSRNLPVVGTLGLVERADKLGLIEDFQETLRQIKASGFFIDEPLEQQLVQRHRSRRGAK